MQHQLSFEEFKQLAQHSKRVMISREIPADIITPIAAYQALSLRGEGSVLIEYQEPKHYTYLAFRPGVRFEVHGKKSVLKIKGKTTEEEGNPFDILNRLIALYSCATSSVLPDLVGGSVGFIGHPAVRFIEKIPDRHPKVDGVPDLYFQFHGQMLLFDHQKGTLLVGVAVDVNHENDLRSLQQHYVNGIDQIDAIVAQLIEGTPLKMSNRRSVEESEVETDLSDVEFGRLVEQAKEYIAKGDIFQVVISRCFKKKCAATALNLFRAMRIMNHSPFLFLVDTQDYALVGASPERLVSVKGRDLETMPIAGTRPRCAGGDDETLARELLDDPKESAEHLMLVDLARNDLGAVSVAGSIKVKSLKKIQRFPSVMHMVSLVSGTLREGLGVLDVLKSSFPAGTLSGAPKIRAMEIIDELEISARGTYGGAICMIDNRGNLDSWLIIRTAVLKNGVATVRTGAGIVHDSDPQKEADETRHKASGVLKALTFAESL